jgi:hypothetical protein
VIKTIVIGVWAAIVALIASYSVAEWKAEVKPGDEKPYVEGLEYRKLEPLTVPMIADGLVQGYVLARLVFTADAGALRKLKVAPEPFVSDEAFREIYNNGRVEFGKLAKYNLDQIVAHIKENTNKRLGADFVHDILIEEINYADRRTMKN